MLKLFEDLFDHLRVSCPNTLHKVEYYLKPLLCVCPVVLTNIRGVDVGSPSKVIAQAIDSSMETPHR